MLTLCPVGIGTVSMSKMDELIRFTSSGCSAFDRGTIEQNLDDCDVPLEVACVDVGLREFVGRDRGIPLGRSEAAMPKPLFQGQQRHRFFRVVQLRRDGRSGAVTGDRTTNVSVWDTCLP